MLLFSLSVFFLFFFHFSLFFPFRFSNFLFSKLKSLQHLKRGAPDKLLDLIADFV